MTGGVRLSRKEFFKHSAIASLGLAAPPMFASTGSGAEIVGGNQSFPGMKIKDIRPIVLADRHIFVQVLTEEGIAGIGQPSQSGPNNAKIMIAWFESLRNILVGEDPRYIEAAAYIVLWN